MNRLAIALAVAGAGAACGGGSARLPVDGGPVFDPDGGALPEGTLLGEVLVQEFRAHNWQTGADDYQWGSVSVSFYGGAFPSWHQVSMTEGACVLRTPIPPAGCVDCYGVCTGPNECATYPPFVSGGAVTLAGLKLTPDLATLTPELEPGTDSWTYRYGLSGMGVAWEGPADLFDAGDAVGAASAGAAVPAVTLAAAGVAPIVTPLPGGVATFVPGQDHRLRWTPSGRAGARIHVTFNASNEFHGQPLPVIIDCDAPDSAGELIVPRAMVDTFPESEGLIACVRRDCPPSYLSRYTRGVATVPGGYVTLVVEDRLPFGVDHHP